MREYVKAMHSRPYGHYGTEPAGELEPVCVRTP